MSLGHRFRVGAGGWEGLGVQRFSECGAFKCWRFGFCLAFVVQGLQLGSLQADALLRVLKF